MTLRTSVQMLTDAVRRSRVIEDPEVVECLSELASGVDQAQQLSDAVIQLHYDTHEIVSPRLCCEACRLAVDA